MTIMPSRGRLAGGGERRGAREFGQASENGLVVHGYMRGVNRGLVWER